MSCAINQCPGQPGREHFQTHLQQIMPAIPPSPRDRKASLMNHCPFRSAAEWSSPCCVYRVLLCLLAKTATKIGCRENGRVLEMLQSGKAVLIRTFLFRNVNTYRRPVMWLNFILFDLWKCVICPFMKPLRPFLPSGVQYVRLFICIPYLAC